MSARERLPSQRLSESFSVECALDVRQAQQASCQRQELMTAGEHRCTPSRPDTKLAVDTHQLESAEILRARRLLDENVSFERAWSEMQASRGRAASSTVEALVFSLRAGGTALACPHARRRLAQLAEGAVARGIGAVADISTQDRPSMDTNRSGAPGRCMERFTWIKPHRCLSKLSNASGVREESQRLVVAA